MQIRRITLATPAPIRLGVTRKLDEIPILKKIYFFVASRLKKRKDMAQKTYDGTRIKKIKPKVPNKKLLAKLLIIVVAIPLLIYGFRSVSNDRKPTSDERQEIKGAKAAQDIKRDFTFPLRDANGEEVSEILFIIEKAELRDEIIVQGQKATAVKGRTFLILTLKITNNFDQAIEIDTRDYVRLVVNGDHGEWLAPDIHNDPVEVQAISTKYTRVGFPLNDSDINLLLKVGEINGEKQDVELKFN